MLMWCVQRRSSVRRVNNDGYLDVVSAHHVIDSTLKAAATLLNLLQLYFIVRHSTFQVTAYKCLLLLTCLSDLSVSIVVLIGQPASFPSCWPTFARHFEWREHNDKRKFGLVRVSGPRPKFISSHVILRSNTSSNIFGTFGGAETQKKFVKNYFFRKFALVPPGKFFFANVFPRLVKYRKMI